MGIYYVRVPSMGLRKIYMVLRYRLVHCEVTGYSEGTAYDPKFSLKILFQYKIISEIAYLGGQGGHYYGYMPVIQGDSARPYEERSYIQFIKRNCEGKAWYW